MSSRELNASNKKNAGKGNGNSVINNHEKVSNVKGDSEATLNDKYRNNTQNKK
jgi:hypothetical protein